eukprot:13695604-Ditylum_brightwellii.AAC.1
MCMFLCDDVVVKEIDLLCWEMVRYSLRMGRESGRKDQSWGCGVVANAAAGAFHGGSGGLARARIP